ncbi:ATP-binding cassette domain-containing protein, partial [Salmonella enterica]|uniref:ATP-binding cassette domain-containing protein n=1 Tax=Salmonella enterica TaxID=28901 RepID=UPI00398C7849
GLMIMHSSHATQGSAPTATWRRHPATQQTRTRGCAGCGVPRRAVQAPLPEVDKLRFGFQISKGILKRVVDHNVVVNNISFTLHPGDTLGLVGESGSEKSTTGLALLRLIRAEGRSVFDGQSRDTVNGPQPFPVTQPIQVLLPVPSLTSISRF